MPGARRYALLTIFAVVVAAAGCCERKGYVLRGDIAIELNRVSHLIGRHDDYEQCPGDCDCAECVSMDAWDGGSGGAMSGADPRLHPVPTRPVFAPERVTPAPQQESLEGNTPPTSRRPSGSSRSRVAQVGHTSPRQRGTSRR